MDTMDINEIVDSVFPNGLSLQAGLELVWPVAFYVLGIAAYAVFIFRFYRFIASRDMFALDLSSYEQSRFVWVRRILHVIMYTLKYLIVFPAFAFFWFAILTFILALLSKERGISEILVIALATVGVIRVAAYYSEELSRDVAKILPFAVLGLFLIDASFFEVGKSLNVLRDAEDYRESIFYYMIALIALEFAMRLILGTVALFIRWKNTPMRPVAEHAVAGDPSAPTVEWPDWEEDVENCHSPTDTDVRAEKPAAEPDEEEQRSDEKTNAPAVPQTSTSSSQTVA